jgi:hypothetical protein
VRSVPEKSAASGASQEKKSRAERIMSKIEQPLAYCEVEHSLLCKQERAAPSRDGSPTFDSIQQKASMTE